MIRRFLAALEQKRAHQRAMRLVFQGQHNARILNRQAWYEYYRVKG